MPLFHRHYRSADVLLIDDIQILAGKERTQEEFFHTFNELYDHQKQIVISSDSAPKSTPGLVERLRSRFEWGLMVDIQPPDLETKMAILDKKAEIGRRRAAGRRPHLHRDENQVECARAGRRAGQADRVFVGDRLAHHAGDGAAGSEASDRRSGARDHHRIDLRAVAERFQLQPAQLKQKTNAQQIAYPRQIAMYLVKELTQASLPEIGRPFGGKHHTTVLHSIQKIDELRQQRPGFEQADPQRNRLIPLRLWRFSTAAPQYGLWTAVEELRRAPNIRRFRTLESTGLE